MAVIKATNETASVKISTGLTGQGNKAITLEKIQRVLTKSNKANSKAISLCT